MTSLVETQAGVLSMATRGSAARGRAGHHSKGTGIEIGVQAGTPLFRDVDLEPDDTDPGDFDASALMIKHVAPTPAVLFYEPAPVVEYVGARTCRHI